MLHQPSLPGIPLDGVREVSVHVRLWGSGVVSGFLRVTSGPTPDECCDECIQTTGEKQPEQIQQLIHGLMIAWGTLCRQMAQPFPPLVDEAIEDIMALYGHLL